MKERIQPNESWRYSTKCVGKILKEIKGSCQVGLLNGLYIILPKDRWELCDKSISVPDNIENQDSNKNIGNKNDEIIDDE